MGGTSDESKIESVRKKQREWEERFKKAARGPFETTNPSGRAIRPLYTPADLPEFDYERDLSVPGEFPFTRGPHTTMYR